MKEKKTNELYIRFYKKRNEKKLFFSEFWKIYSVSGRQISTFSIKDKVYTPIEEIVGKECVIFERSGFHPASKEGIFQRNSKGNLVFIENNTNKVYVVREVEEHVSIVKKYKL